VPLAGVTVVDDVPGLSQAEAKAYGKAFIASMAWMDWSMSEDAPSVLVTLPLNTALSGVYEMEEDGGTLTSSVPGVDAYPNQIVLYPLTKSDQTSMANTSQSFAVAVSYAAASSYPYKWKESGSTPPFPLSGHSGAQTPGIFTGTLASNSILGTYFKLDTFDFDCSSGPDLGICQAAGVS
jgi:hypothetical protein